MTMIIRFQLGNICMRNKGTLFSDHIFPTHTLSSLSSGINLVLIVQLCVIATNYR